MEDCIKLNVLCSVTDYPIIELMMSLHGMQPNEIIEETIQQIHQLGERAQPNEVTAQYRRPTVLELYTTKQCTTIWNGNNHVPGRELELKAVLAQQRISQF